MYDYYLNLFRPYRNYGRNEMSVTRAFIVACAKSPSGQDFLRGVMKKAGCNISFVEENISRLGLEVPGGSISFKDECEKAVLCISQHGNIVKDDLLAELYSSTPNILDTFSTIVLRDSEQPDLPKLRKHLLEVFPNLDSTLKDTDENDMKEILNSAYWDIWRLLYAGARADAVVWNDQMICLIESKIWGSVYEIQVRNHAIEFFGRTQVPLYSISWQTIRDIASTYSDSVISDLVAYVDEFPQLVRWDGFDGCDLRAFEMNDGKINEEGVLQARLLSRYWQSMEDLCNTYDYDVSARRSDDWDFTPKGFRLIGNTGIGYWGCGRLSAKWCFGYHAKEMDRMMGHPDIAEKGEIACESLASTLSTSSIKNGLSVEMRAVQRFQFANAEDGAWFDGSSCSILDMDDLKSKWNYELGILKQFHTRRGLQLSSERALDIKRDVFKMRYPDAPISEMPDKMKTAHPTWNLFAAFDLFVHIDPNAFIDSISMQLMSKTEQLEALDFIVNAVAQFAEIVSG